jgi:hypothetical protein
MLAAQVHLVHFPQRFQFRRWSACRHRRSPIPMDVRLGVRFGILNFSFLPIVFSISQQHCKCVQGCRRWGSARSYFQIPILRAKFIITVHCFRQHSIGVHIGRQCPDLGLLPPCQNLLTGNFHPLFFIGKSPVAIRLAIDVVGGKPLCSYDLSGEALIGGEKFPVFSPILGEFGAEIKFAGDSPGATSQYL